MFSNISFHHACSGFKKETHDTAIIIFPPESQTVAVFTQNRFVAAPVIVARQHLKQTSKCRALLINSGNANCGNGEKGLDFTRSSCQHLSQALQCQPEQILPFSTGIINLMPKTELIISGIDQALTTLPCSVHEAAKAIMTTDTRPKLVESELTLKGKKVRIQGIAKGSGMIQPNMATMLGFVWSDISISKSILQQSLETAVNHSFNCISVDGDTSTNDSCSLTLTGSSGVFLQPRDSEWRKWQEALNQIFIQLAQTIVKDGEGATKFIEIQVEEGNTEEECRKVAFSVANSPLVKTAFFAGDPNLGRIAAAAGRAGVPFDFERIKIYLEKQLVMESGQIHHNYDEQIAKKDMKDPKIRIRLLLGRGLKKATIWTTDFSYEYVRINAEYRS